MSTPKPKKVDVVDKGSGPHCVYDAAAAFRQSAALFAACRLGLFDGLDETGGAHDARDVASRLSDIGFVDVTITSLFPHMAIMARKLGNTK